MFDFLPWKSKKELDAVKVETGTFDFEVTNEMIIRNITYKGVPVVAGVRFHDPVPPGADARFSEAYFGLEPDVFNSMKEAKYRLSFERKRKKTTVFASTGIVLKDNKTAVNFTIEAEETRLVIQARARSSFKAYWGMTAFVIPEANAKFRKLEKEELKKFKRSEFPPASASIAESDKARLTVMSTYGNAAYLENGSLSLSATLDGSDREVINSWRIKANLANHNVLTITAELRQ